MGALLLFFGSLALYVITLPGTVPAYRDSGDLINAITTLGIAHPPGYPVYVNLGKLFITAVPLANAAYRVNVFSAACAAAAVAAVYVFSKKALSASALACAAAAVWFALTPAVMSLARAAEMYTLAALFAAGIVGCYFDDTPRSRLLGCYLIGLGFGVHPTLLFLSPLFFTTKMRDSLWRLGMFLLGFSVVFVLLVRARQGPVQNWGNPNNLIELWRLITRSNYGGLKLHPAESQFSWTPGSVLHQLVFFFKTFLGQWKALGLAAGGMGLAWVSPKDRRLIVCFLLTGPIFFVLSNLPIQEATSAPILQPYLVMAGVLWVVWVARGFQMVLTKARSSAFQGLLFALLLMVPVGQLRGSFRSYRQDFYVYDLARNMIRTLPTGAVLYDPDDPVAFTVRSLQLLENRRPDVVLLNFFKTRWGYEQIAQRWPDMLPNYPVRNAQELNQLFWTYSIKKRAFYSDIPSKVPPGLFFQSEGIVYPIRTVSGPPSDTELRRSQELFTVYPWRGFWRTTRPTDFFTDHIINTRASAYCNLGLRFAERREWDTARRLYWQALSIDPHLTAAYNNLGVIDFELKRYAKAAENYRWALRYDPGNPGFQNNLSLALQKTPSYPH